MSLQDQGRASPQDVIGVGAAFSIAGLYFMLGALGYLPMPETNGPSFIVFCIGASFLFAGFTCMVRARAGLPLHKTNVPHGAKISHRALAIAAAGALATIGAWAAVGSGPRAFNLSTPYTDMQTAGEMVGRVVFALGTVIALILSIALTVGTVRKIFDRAGR